MATFRSEILGNDLLISGLRARGFVLSEFDSGDENRCSFMRLGHADIHVVLLISIWDDGSFRCALIISSMFVSKVFHRCGLFLDLSNFPTENRPEGVLTVELLWLKWNDNPEIAQSDDKYSLKGQDGVRRLLEDLDTLGQAFISSVATPQQLADFLLKLDEYPARIKWGGKPGSADPFIFAAILYIEAGEKVKARAALARGLREYDFPEPRLHWQTCRQNDFKKRRELLLTEIGAE
ncbi:MAG: hypothetical protein P4L91_20930 [Burkholderiaceae bacterium]|nr:hypothetical protein [Burkholderiaceae bacterium]